MSATPGPGPASASGPAPDSGPERTRAVLLAEHRDDGILAARLPLGAVPGAEAAWLTVAVLVALAPAVPGTPGAAAAWIAAGTVLALVGSCGRGWPRLRWPAPALLRALEYGSVLVLAGGSAQSYALLSVLAFHHYDIVYRLRLRGEGPPPWLGAVTGGWAVRLGVLAAAAAFGVTSIAVTTLAVLLAPIYVLESITSWSAPSRTTTDPGPQPTPDP